MEYLKRYPKMAYASLALLIVSVSLMWAEWITIGQASLAGSMIQLVSNMGSGISFAGGCSAAMDLAEMSKRANNLLGGILGNGVQNIIGLVNILSIVYIVLFAGTITAVGYCFYARLKWKSGMREGVYFLFFAGDVAIMFILMNLLNKIAGAGAYKMGVWGFAALGCALLSEILWEEASFNTPKPGTEAWNERMKMIRSNKG